MLFFSFLFFWCKLLPAWQLSRGLKGNGESRVAMEDIILDMLKKNKTATLAVVVCVRKMCTVKERSEEKLVRYGKRRVFMLCIILVLAFCSGCS